MLIVAPFCGKILATLPFFTSISSSWKGTVCAAFSACSAVRVVKSIKLPPVALARYCIFGVLATAEALTTVIGILACFTTSFTENSLLPKLKMPSLKRSNSSALRLKLMALPSVAPSYCKLSKCDFSACQLPFFTSKVRVLSVRILKLLRTTFTFLSALK